ncbi:hypothetical protein TSAR_015523 [Trichomalopsis sarcophagae]|uniref:Ionotropic glutamate receptor C-terminal domain-containing protein n=1 Tax=Trichomalopsis sarcophagae TaxID=543379 RepID=A0A232F1L5_9HYME|nr:hypothetical protein TSAR_015523 [Trichomalopsis sarcophagae]
MYCPNFLLNFFLFYLFEHRFIPKVSANTAKSHFHLSFKNEQLMLEKLLDTCVRKKWDNNVLLVVENADHCPTSKCSFSRHIPIHLFQINANFDSRRGFRESYLSNETQIAKYHKPTSCAIIIASNMTEFTKLMLKIKNSIWWQHGAYFVIVNIDYIDTCQLAYAFLKQAWKFNILSVLYICKNANDQEEAYTFNPYAEVAPKLWTKVDLHSKTSDSNWSLFQLTVDAIPTSSKHGRLECNNLFFDKSKNLHGTNLKVALKRTSITNHYNSTMSGYKRFTSPGFSLIASVFHRMNATVTVKFSDTHGFISPFGEPQSLLNDLISGTVSVIMNIRLLRHYWNFQVHSFHAETVAIVSLKKQITLIEKVENVIGSTFFAYLFILSLAFTVSLKYIFEQSISLAALNYLRICLGISSATVPRHSVKRILLILLIIFAFVFNSCLLSLLTALESSSNRVPVIDSYGDLIKSNSVIYGVDSLKELIWQKDVRDRFRSVKETGNCFDRLLKGDSSIACVGSRFHIGYFGSESELIHVSKFNLVNRGHSYLIAEDFPLFSKIHWLLLKMNEGGLVDLMFTREACYHHFRYSENYTVERLGLKNLHHVFTILIGFWVLATPVLCVEVITFKIKKFLSSRNDVDSLI